MKTLPGSLLCALAFGTLVLTDSHVEAQTSAPRIRPCATFHFTPTEKRWIQEQLITRYARVASRADFKRSRANYAGTIPVVFHIVHDGEEGRVERNAIDAQMDVLNAAFAPIQFSLAEVQYVDRAAWFEMNPFFLSTLFSKLFLQRDTTTTLNIYTGKLNGGFLGWAWFPFLADYLPLMDAVTVDYGTLPGGTLDPYNEGDTIVHEVGHWAGLFHTFQGCWGPGDWVQDTPPQGAPSYGCGFFTTDTCPFQPGAAPANNYMDYATDPCATEFTPGQEDRMRWSLITYRPQIWQRLLFGN
jgi:hypothetical protein